METRKRATIIALRIVILYAVIAALWIVLSDRALMVLFEVPQTLTRMQTYKGWFFVLATATLLFVVLYAQVRSLLDEERRRQEAQQEAREWSERLQHYLHVSPVITYALSGNDRELTPVWVSENIHNVLGFGSDEVLRPDWWRDHIHPEDMGQVLKNQQKLLSEGAISQEFRVMHRDGSYIWIHDQARSAGRSGFAQEIIGTWADVSTRKSAELALQETLCGLEQQIAAAVEKARQQDSIIFDQMRRQALNTLLINIAHQWRQPLNGIGLIIQDMGDQLDSDNPQKQLIHSTIVEAMAEVNHLSDTISTFTDLYQASNTAPEKISLHATFQQALFYLQAKPLFSRVTLLKNIPDTLQVKGVEIEIIELFMEIIQNAMTVAAARERDRVDIRIEAARTPHNTITITIADNAGGIDSSILPSMFEPYTTTQFKSRDKGLGLYMMKRLIEERYQGSIAATNGPDGAIFTITLPVAD
ncbi:PAS domain-containing protein [Desulfurispirillum indicum]|uniref:histidine kinase n=1 Tax=Desulfurispirillum indicum (strain ATCC BAA-1389 / DSM 22839 / S5) TaxID=653733 RepID=E6W5W3_DESIS|nr:PAS domain-containing sensor histidine kinase [Desulfurispirillum indicum]ADU67248.1 PAS sensor protein [Desulfurispirillum indicum S5]UCZ56598.1 PAS domain-containing protein [Desulfurispirillum indicum]